MRELAFRHSFIVGVILKLNIDKSTKNIFACGFKLLGNDNPSSIKEY